MTTVILKDGSKREFQDGATGDEIAHAISPKLQKQAVAIRINGALKDLTLPVPDHAEIDIVVRDSEDGLEIIRHDTAHILAQSVKELYPETQITIGPAIANGFYYDFAREKSFTTEDFEKIESHMRKIIQRNDPFVREEWDREDAIAFFKNQGEHFKAELIESIPQGEVVSIYKQGEFADLCRGPHMPSTGRIGTHFKLMKLAGSYWRGDHRNPVLQRMYGTAWATEKQLKDHLFFLEEAAKRDHRKLGAELDLFHLQEEAIGSVFWHDKGWRVYRLLETYIRAKLEKCDYIEVKTPQLVDKSLWEASGHWEKFREDMFIVDADDKTLALKPMNCPCHIQIFKHGLKSYRDLPLRMAEFGSCFRNEASGALHGLMRVRSLTQDDAHIFCTPDQIVSEAKLFFDLLKDIYKDLGFDSVKVRFSDRPEKRAGTDADWDQTEEALKNAAAAAGLECTLNPGEGAFYGPKLEFVLKDSLEREWQCGTLQVDTVLPERLDATYIGEDGKKHRPVMLHRAILGTFERFLGILIESCGGKFPLWLAPVQCVIATVTSDADHYAQKLYKDLKSKGIRAEIDVRNEKISYKVREHSHQKAPYILAVGAREADEGTVSVRTLGSKNQSVQTFDAFVDSILPSCQLPV